MQSATRNTQHATHNELPCHYLELPLTDYQDAWKLQLAIVDAKKNGILKADVALMLEHPPVFTLGRRGASKI